MPTWQITPLQCCLCYVISQTQIHARSHPGSHVLLEVLTLHCFDNCVQEQTHWMHLNEDNETFRKLLETYQMTGGR